MLIIVAFQLKQIFNQNLIFFSKWHATGQVLQSFANLQNIAEVFANFCEFLEHLFYTF